MQKDTLVDTQNWFLKAVPNPTSKNISTQMGCHLEEVEEMLRTIYPNGNYDAELLQRAQDALTNLANHLKRDDTAYRIQPGTDLLDSLADQIVTATGVGVFLGMNVPGALAEVNRSNYSKFEDGEPVFNENKKVMKGKDYTPPDLSKFI